jgi:hypothetical protein
MNFALLFFGSPKFRGESKSVPRSGRGRTIRIVACLLICTPIPWFGCMSKNASNRVIARFNHTEVTETAFKAFLLESDTVPLNRMDLATRHRYLDRFIRSSILKHMVEQAGIANDPHLLQQMVNANNSVENIVCDAIAKKSSDRISQKQVNDFYQSRNLQQRLASHEDIFISRLRFQSWSQANEALALLKKGRSFESTARTLSVECDTRFLRGDRRPIYLQEPLPADAEKAAFALKPGGISNILKINLTEYLILGRHFTAKPSASPEGPARDNIVETLKLQKVMDKLAKETAASDVQVDEKLLNALQ